ncbi:hypothetical protein SAMN04487983_104937 [Streptomyces sp. yr375]|uniref:hypothetical protein n=1 Tax=Streptomyces sp. yr375 TaxID=1761906 RepID=UPI0008C5B98F|nr:hypothetical protein [Streptomyces sp. yr375]SES40340.1 hypothetical protein SAMN04487983_104937 [Streptomyces sp. yr375]
MADLGLQAGVDRQSTDRQNLVPDETGIEEPVTFEEEAGASRRLHPLERPKFGEPLTWAVGVDRLGGLLPLEIKEPGTETADCQDHSAGRQLTSVRLRPP